MQFFGIIFPDLSIVHCFWQSIDAKEALGILLRQEIGSETAKPRLISLVMSTSNIALRACGYSWFYER
jgi:hypothetical protein